MNRTIEAAVLLFLLTGSSGARAQEPRIADTPAGVHLRLDEAIARGLDTSRRLAALKARGDAARAEATVERSGDNPTVSIQAGYTRTNHVTPFQVLSSGGFQTIYPDVPDNYRTRLDVQWPIYSGGRTSALVEAAEAEAGATDSDLATARADLVLEITRAYWADLTAVETERVLEQALARVEAQLNDVRNQLDAGLVAPSDVMSVEAQRSRQRLLLIDARNQQEIAAADLRRLTGLAPDAPFTLASSLTDPTPPPASVEALIAEAHDQRPERQAYEQRIRAAERRTDAAAAGRRPFVAVGGGYDYANPNPLIFPREAAWLDSWDLSVNVSWDIWDGGRSGADVAEARANAVAVTAELAEFDDELGVEVRQRRLDLLSRLESIETAEDGVRSAAEARRVTADRFAAGVATSTELLDAQVVLLSAELDRTRAQAEARLAEARLRRAIGR
jgi:outer membrane protein TolC